MPKNPACIAFKSDILEALKESDQTVVPVLVEVEIDSFDSFSNISPIGIFRRQMFLICNWIAIGFVVDCKSVSDIQNKLFLAICLCHGCMRTANLDTYLEVK